jgi:predicted component of type VI protein secretion system
MSSNSGMEFLRTTVRWAVVFGCAAVAGAQSPQQPASQGGCYLPDASGKQVFVPNCGLDQAPARKTPAAPADGANPAQQFPFPGETPSQPAAPVERQQPQPGNGQVQGAPPSGAGASDPAQAFPFPGEDKTPLVKPDGTVAPPDAPSGNGGGLKDAGSSGESSSGSSSSSSSGGAFNGLPPDDPDSKGPLADDDTVIKKPHKVVPKAKEQTASEREAEDLSVAGFYMADNNFRGAYLRAADAVTVQSDDPDAHLALADAARKLGKLDEALAEYKKTLTLDPVPKAKKAAEKAIKELH